MHVPYVGARSGRRRFLTLAVALVTLSLVMPAGALAAKPPITPPHAVNVQLLAINDFHGNLEPPSGSGGRVGTVLDDAACTAAGVANCVFAGGVAYLADDIKDLEATNPNTLVVSAGDNIGARRWCRRPSTMSPRSRRSTCSASTFRRRQPRVRRGGRRTGADPERWLPPDRRLPNRPRVCRRRFPVPGRQRRLQGHRRDHLPGLHRQDRGRRQGGLHRADARGDAEYRQRRRDCSRRLPGRGRPPSMRRPTSCAARASRRSSSSCTRAVGSRCP